MTINYKRLFNLVIGHNYFADGFDRFVTLTPLEETRTLLKNSNMLFKKVQHGITVLFRTGIDGITPLIPISGKQNFRFYMSANNAAGLLNITDLDEPAGRNYMSGNILFYTNNPANASNNKSNPEIVEHSIIDSLQPQLFTFSFTLSGNPASVLMKVTDTDGNPVSIGEDIDGNPLPTTLSLTISHSNMFGQQIDLRKKQKGRYTINILDSTGTTILKEEKIYADDLLSGKKILGITEIQYDNASAHLYGLAEEYKIQFSRTVSVWKYFIINKSKKIDFNTESLIISDSGTINGSPYQINNFNRAYSGILIEANSPGEAGNNIIMAYSGGGTFPALILSGETLSDGTATKAANGIITLINNSVNGYTLTINGTGFTEGSEFIKGATPEDTANAIVTAINGDASVAVTASLMHYDFKVNELPSLVFRSEENIPFYELPKSNIQLRKASNNQTIAPHLPNPSLSTIRKAETGVPEAEVYVFI
ncbi:MAG: hypothetical protein JXB34_10505 [Bacteroidales bacterium]|nr:hypothetical protein [Bacteroidales bacterium]